MKTPLKKEWTRYLNRWTRFVINLGENRFGQAGLSLRAGGRGFTPAIMNMTSNYSCSQIEPNELPKKSTLDAVFVLALAFPYRLIGYRSCFIFLVFRTMMGS